MAFSFKNYVFIDYFVFNIKMKSSVALFVHDTRYTSYIYYTSDSVLSCTLEIDILNVESGSNGTATSYCLKFFLNTLNVIDNQPEMKGVLI